MTTYTQHQIVSGLLYDFMGWLTSREQEIILSSRHHAEPAVNAIVDFAKMRGIDLSDPAIKYWKEQPPFSVSE